MPPLLAFFSLVMRKRLAVFAADLDRPAAAQARRLRCILRVNSGCAFGREHGFAGIGGVDDYRRAVPIRAYEDFSPWIERMRAGRAGELVSEPVEMFATTSGTTAEPKYCAVTRSFTREHHDQHLLWMWHLARDHPRILQGAFLSLVSPATAGFTPGGTPYGSSSGRQYQNQSWPVRRRHAVPHEVFELPDYDARYHALLVFALAREISIATSVNPSSLVLLARIMSGHAEELLADLETGTLRHAPGLSPRARARLERRLRPAPERARRLRDVLRADGHLLPRAAWPGLRVVVTWHGGSAPFYLSQLDELWGPTPRRCLGLRASEGTFSLPLADHTPGGVLAVGGHFLEFLPEDVEPGPGSETLLAHELETGKRYRLLITTSGGFYRYDLADIVEVVGRRQQTPEVAFLHKAGNVLSITGEKVTENQVVAVMRAIGRGRARRSPPPAGFTVTLELVDPPRYLLAVEPAAGIPSAAAAPALVDLIAAFDRELQAANEEYAAKRASGRLAAPRLLLLAPGSYAAYRRALAAEGRPDNQVKPPHLVQPAGPGPAPVRGCPFFDRVRVILTPRPGAGPRPRPEA